MIYDLQQDTSIAWRKLAINRPLYLKHISRHVMERDNSFAEERWIHVLNEM